MSTVVIDVLYIKKIERIAGRKLTEEELERVRFNEPICVETPNGSFIKWNVPTYLLPEDLSPESIDYEDIFVREKKHYARYRNDLKVAGDEHG